MVVYTFIPSCSGDRLEDDMDTRIQGQPGPHSDNLFLKK
jgi:hypothetical protein